MLLDLTRWVALGILLGTGTLAGQPTQPDAFPVATQTITKYCTGCHNARLKTGGLALDPATLSNPGANAETWEAVVRKLQARLMPPPGMPRPDETAYNTVRSYLEARLDAAEKAAPNPGKVPPFHRLTRTEYQNAIRDLLGLDHLPKEIDYTSLLPPDNTSSGFDNLADLLFISPAAMESYVNAARKISRLAVGDPTAPVMVNLYSMSPELPQEERVDGLPFGTRGGLAVDSYFPLDAEYALKVDLAGSSRDSQQVDVTIDGERVKLMTIDRPQGGGRGGRGGRGAGESKPMEFRVRIKAGPHRLGVAFLQHDEAWDEATLRPRMRSRGTETAIASLTVSGPYESTGPGDTPSRERIFVCHPGSAAEEQPCARKILLSLARHAWRRPVTESDIQDLMHFYAAERTKANFERGIEEALERLLVSPQFLFRIERDPAGIAPGTNYRISGLELASRLSFFIWSSIPDDELLDLAAAGKLSDPVVLGKQVSRMFADPRSESLVTNFAEQWLYLRDIEAKQPDEVLFPDFDETLREAFRKETDLFLDSVLRSDKSVTELLTANYSFLNERLARHYGIPNVEGSYFRAVTFPPGSPRGGLLGQGSILTLTSYSTRTSPVLRGKWVLENIFAAPPPPPPPNVPALNTSSRETGKALTMRQAMSLHRAQEPCASCHARMDPIGFAMDNFDAVGQWRTTDAEQPIDASGVLPDGTKFNGVAEMKKDIVRSPEEFVSAVAEKLLMYGIGRNVHYFDRPALRAIVRGAAQHSYTFSSLVLGVVESVPFQMRESQSPAVSARLASK
jgi:mono/diheme cytochrome c family protein